MKKILLAVSAILALLMFSGCGDAKKTLPESVIKNLQAAYNGESNAAAKYEFYAKKSAEAGYNDIATLFKAAAKSEAIHAQREAAVLKEYGIEAIKDIKEFTFTDVAAALADAKKGEDYEIATMYPQFIADAKAKGVDGNVIEVFEGALGAEKMHSNLYQAAMEKTDDWKDSGKKFMVCVVCGYTDYAGGVTSCPVCAATDFIIFDK